MSAAGGRQQLMRDLDNGSLEITQSMEDDPLLEAPLPPHALHSGLRPKFYAIPTVCFANILLLMHVAFVILAFLAGNAALLLILSVQHSFPDHSKLYLCFILAILTVELICSLICLVIYTAWELNGLHKMQHPNC
ncbi:UNVERIFIED_CONTAM: hypothetical protein K2H54_049913 [Gekko kuhli]